MPRPQGASVFTLRQGGASSTSARWLAAQENKADQVDVELADALMRAIVSYFSKNPPLARNRTV
jgi:hypothetical protein